ncbi:hypothetical protein L3V83_14385 [Thiotrichales bacterium 19X7-9]|nr:hypothetical protein [Thiotrichales bacterium 19X7-9]MCF6777755.1 hypothetical protein [Thiotrichales bacterium 19X7-9]
MTLREQWEAKATKKGIKQGLEQGLEQGRLEMAKNMLQYGDSIDKIVAITGLEKATILKLKKDIKNYKKK